jgi:hypothetical protein
LGLSIRVAAGCGTVRRHGSVAVWQCGSVAVWQCGSRPGRLWPRTRSVDPQTLISTASSDVWTRPRTSRSKIQSGKLTIDFALQQEKLKGPSPKIYWSDLERKVLYLIVIIITP